MNKQQSLLNKIKTQGALSVRELSKQLSISLSMVHRYLNVLEDEGRIRKRGSGPQVVYEAVEEHSVTSQESLYFGPPHAVFNLSKMGLRYFRMGFIVPEERVQKLVGLFSAHPNVGWVFSAHGWFNLIIGLWVKDNAELSEVATQIRVLLPNDCRVVFQSELMSLYGFGNRPISGSIEPMCIVDSRQSNITITPAEQDFIKLLALDSSLSDTQFSDMLHVSKEAVVSMRKKLTDGGIISGYQERINYSGLYYKVFIDTHSAAFPGAGDQLVEGLWHDPACIYLARANGTFDVEFEVVVNTAQEIKKYVKNFSINETVVISINHYTNLYPLNKVANIQELRDSIALQKDEKVVNLQNSKLWYLNHVGAEAYLDIYRDREYFSLMAKDEIALFKPITEYIRVTNPGKKFHIVDLGSGDGKKGKLFIEELSVDAISAYYPVDIQAIELQKVLTEHQHTTYPKHPVLLDFENLDARFPLPKYPQEETIYMLLGGTYGNYESKIINDYVSVLLKSDGLLLVAISITDRKSNEQQITNSYSTIAIENVAFGPLLQYGFKKEDFAINPRFPSLRMTAAIEGDRNVISFRLKHDVHIQGDLFVAGTVFKSTTSWKPTLPEFEAALSTHFKIEKIFSQESMAIALVRKK